MNNRHGIALIECLVYIVVLSVVLTIAYPAYYRYVSNARGLTQNADDIVRALRAGERWRDDLRGATGPIRPTPTGLIVPVGTGSVRYEFSDNSVWRQTGAARVVFLKSVASSVMQADPRRRVRAWRWELELAGRPTRARLRPLFTFVAVDGRPQ